MANILSEPTDQLYKQMVNSNGPINPFMSADESIGDTVSVWTLFSHTGIYITALGSLIPTDSVVTFPGANLPDWHTDLYNQVLCDILLWVTM